MEKQFQWDLQLFATGDGDGGDENEELEIEEEDEDRDDLNTEEENDEDLTPDQKLEKANKQLEKFGAFKDIIDAVEKDPTKINDIRAAAAGKKKGDDEEDRPRRQAAPEPPVQRETEEQRRQRRKETNDRLRTVMLDPDGDILEVLDPLIEERAERRVGALRRDAAGILETTVETFLDRFISRKEDEENPAVFKAARKAFLKDTADLNRAQMMSLPADVRARELDYRWGAAVASAYREKVKTPARVPGGTGRGTVMNDAPRRGQQRDERYKLSDKEKAYIRANMPKDKAEKEIRDLEAGRI